MNINNLHNPRHIHFIGIDGISMSALAAIMLRRGWVVSGSDLKQSSLTKKLVREGATFFLGHSADNLDGAEVVVYTAAVKPDNPELRGAREKGIDVLSRAEFLGTLMGEAACGIAISGSHGKTTTAKDEVQRGRIEYNFFDFPGIDIHECSTIALVELHKHRLYCFICHCGPSLPLPFLWEIIRQQHQSLL